jgi:hypothetical protein
VFKSTLLELNWEVVSCFFVYALYNHLLDPRPPLMIGLPSPGLTVEPNFIGGNYGYSFLIL